MCPIEQQILTCAAEMKPDVRHRQRMRQLISYDVDAGHLIQMAFREGMSGLLYKNLLESGLLEKLELDHIETLKSQYYQTAGFNLKLIHDFKEVLYPLNQKKIRVVLLQGIDLLHETYEDIGIRPMMDVDLWVRTEDYPELIAILISQGYERDPLYPNTFRRGSTTFDLHTHILWADRIRARKLLLNKSETHIYEEARVVYFEGQEALCLSPSDQVLYLSLHALKHYVNRLIWLVDIKCLVGDWKASDWQLLLNRAKDLGQEKTLCYIFFLLLHLFDLQLPLEARQLLERNRLHFFEKKALGARLKKGALPFWAPALLFSAGKGLRKRVSFTLESLFPRPEILRQIFTSSPDLKAWQLYWKRAVQLLHMVKRSLKGY
ncbi:MAG: nucleotidyltransferase family protein [Desulfobacteraceae bacterium]|jgi:hypothetical protein